MKRLIVLVIATSFAATTFAAPKEREPWRIVRNDYIEFCAGTTLTWDLREGKLQTSRGGCSPYINSPPTVTTTKIKPADLKRLRTLSEQSLDQGISSVPCNSVPIHVLSGPLNFSIVKGDRKVQSPNCMNDLGRRLEVAMAASINRN